MSRRGQRAEVTGKIGVTSSGESTFISDSSATSQQSGVHANVGALAARERNRNSQGVFGGAGATFNDGGKPNSTMNSTSRLRKEASEVTAKVGGAPPSSASSVQQASRAQDIKGRNQSSVNPITGGDAYAVLPSPASNRNATPQVNGGGHFEQAQRVQTKKGRNESTINPITGQPYAMIPVNNSQPSSPSSAPVQQQQQQQQQYQEAEAPYQVGGGAQQAEDQEEYGDQQEEEEKQYMQQQQEQQQAPPQQQQGAGPMSAEEKQEFMYEAAADMSILVKDVTEASEREALLNEQCDKLEAVLGSWTNPELSADEINQRVDWAWSTAIAMNEGKE